MVDAHCHIDLYPDPISIIRSCERKGIYTLGMTNLPSHFEQGFPHVRQCKYVRLALGLHPLHALKHPLEFELFTKCLQMTTYVGEVGLDFSQEGRSTKEKQLESFQFVLQQLDDRKILSLHSRGAEDEVLSMLSGHRIKNAIFHWFTGTDSQAGNIAKAGYYFSINPAMIRSARGQAVIKDIPRDRLLTESDGPFINIQGRIIEPGDVESVLQYLARLHKVSLSEISKQVKANFFSLIRKASIQ